MRKVDANGIITTVAGGGTNTSGDGGPATSVKLSMLSAVAADNIGNVYLATTTTVRMVNTNGIITTVAGNGTFGNTGDGGPATSAATLAYGLSLDPTGNLYIASGGGVRKVTAAGVITTILSSGTTGFNLVNVSSVTLDKAGNVYFTDGQPNFIVGRLNTNGAFSIVAGNRQGGASGDGMPATSAQLLNPVSVAVDSSGNIYIAEAGAKRIRRVDAGGIITTFAGNGLYRSDTADGGLASAAFINAPYGIQIDAAGNIFFSDANQRIRKIDNNGLLSTVATVTTTMSSMALDTTGNLLFTDGAYVRKITPSGAVTIFAGNGTIGFSGDGGPATAAQLDTPYSVGPDAQGNAYIGEARHIRKVDTTGRITTIAGGGTGDDNGPATNAHLNPVLGLLADALGNLYLAEGTRVRKVSTTGVITTVAGSQTYGDSGDGGPATSALLNTPQSLVFDKNGNLYISDGQNCDIRKVDTKGVITHVAGRGDAGFSGDGGLSTEAYLGGYSLSLAIDSTNNIYIADTGNDRIRKIFTPAHAIGAGGIVLGAAFRTTPIAPGSIMTIFGTFPGVPNTTATTLPLPHSLSGVRVLVFGYEAPLLFVGPTQINAQLPLEVTAGSTAPVTVELNSISSLPQNLVIAASSPGIFTLGGTYGNQGAILIANTDQLAMPVTPGIRSQPVSPGGFISIYATGLGLTNPPVATGTPGPTPPSTVLYAVTVTISGQTASALFAGIAPGFVGLYQVNAQVPTTMTPSDTVPVTITQLGNISNTATIAVR